MSLEIPLLCFSKWTSNKHEEPLFVRAAFDVFHIALLIDPHHSGLILNSSVSEDLVFIPGVIIWVCEFRLAFFSCSHFRSVSDFVPLRHVHEVLVLALRGQMSLILFP